MYVCMAFDFHLPPVFAYGHRYAWLQRGNANILSERKKPIQRTPQFAAGKVVCVKVN